VERRFLDGRQFLLWKLNALVSANDLPHSQSMPEGWSIRKVIQLKLQMGSGSAAWSLSVHLG